MDEADKCNMVLMFMEFLSMKPIITEFSVKAKMNIPTINLLKMKLQKRLKRQKYLNLL